MSNVAYILRFGLSDNRFEPAQPQAAGTRGDHRAARLVFTGLEAGANYRLEVVDGGGTYDITELISAPSGSFTYEVPSSWTAPGTAQVRVVKVGDGEDAPCVHYPPVYLYFADREDGEAAGEMLPRWQAVMTRLETSVDTAQSSAADAAQAAQTARAAADRIENAKEVLDTASQTAAQAKADAIEARQRAESVQGVYVGSGEMPDGYNVQIDPSGEAVELADYVVEQGTNGIWTYRKWASGVAEAWCCTGGYELPPEAWTQNGNVYTLQDSLVLELPTGVFSNVLQQTLCTTVQPRDFGSYSVSGCAAYVGQGTKIYNKVYWMVMRHWTDGNTYTVDFNVEVKGRWKEG